jgi:hypothetical protein
MYFMSSTLFRLGSAFLRKRKLEKNAAAEVLVLLDSTAERSSKHRQGGVWE